jgi:RHH-type rel operon transcriptional repressor/antitoxin RelB
MYSGDCMATTVRLEPSTEQRLNHLAQATGRTKAFYLRQLIEQGLDDLEDAYLGAAVAERVRLGQEKTHTLDEVVAELGLDPSDL